MCPEEKKDGSEKPLIVFNESRSNAKRHLWFSHDPDNSLGHEEKWNSANFLIIDVLPLHTVEKPGFRQLLQRVAPNLKLHGRTFYTQLLHTKFHHRRQQLIDALQDSSDAATTIDAWTNHRPSSSAATNEDSLMWSDEEDEEANNHMVYIELGEILEDCYTTQENSAFTLPVHHRCACHLLNLVSKADVEKIDTAFQELRKSTEEKLQKLWNKQSSSSNNSDTIRLYLGQLFILKNETRWNTWYFAIACVVRLLKKKAKAMRKLFDELKIPYFKHEEESYMKEYVKIMKSVTKALDKLQGDKNVGMGFLLPTISVLKANLESLKDKSSIVHCKPLIVGVLNAIHTRFHHMFWENALRLAAISNPMFRLSWLNTEAEINRAQKLLQSEFETYKEDDEEIYVSDSSSDETSSSKSGPSPEKRTKSPEKNFFSKLVNKNAKKQSFHEVDMFLKYCSDLKQLNDYPIIKQIYRRYNVALPSSASVERLFSQGGLIYMPKRLNLSDKHFEMLLFLKVNNKQYTGW
ncbi:hypothetical protein GHT06_019089 [Daphnia sinensis]|uniref:HAT C-terminal dimerisation domain-containing protein n=1 Tax=Daphnia sinensis TaxID=1820382 RepID=A0AAD5L231_9CRUS|nr:hypothetical protein GHT06_019089 [Daphnia sinensis]